MPVDVAAKLVAQTGLTLDYIFLGITSGLPVRIATTLESSPRNREAG
jgi:hypothetical protein